MKKINEQARRNSPWRMMNPAAEAAAVFVEAALDLCASARSPERTLVSLDRLVRSIDLDLSPDAYVRARTAYVSLNHALNEKGFVAPRFRSAPALSRAPGDDPSVEAIALDHEVLDLHWLACQFKRGREEEVILSPCWRVLGRNGFDAEAAVAFATDGRSAQEKASILRLGPRREMEMRVIQSADIEMWWRVSVNRWQRLCRRLGIKEKTAIFGKSDFRDTWIAAQCSEYLGSEEAEFEMVTGYSFDDWLRKRGVGDGGCPF